MNEEKPTTPSSETLDTGIDDLKPSGAPTPVQAVGSVARLLIVGAVGLIAFIIAAAVFVVSNFKQ